MTKNPIYNALGAAGYIFLVVSVMNIVMKYAPKEDSFLAPVLALSMFTLSAAIMGYVFLYHPITLYIDGKRKEGIRLFATTVGLFAIFTSIIVFLVAGGIL